MITLDGQTLESFGLILQPGHEHSILPELRNSSITVPGRNGSIDFGADIGDRVFKFPLAFPYELSRWDVQKKARDFIKFLTDHKGRPRDIQLIFDYDPDKYYTVRVASTVNMERLLSMGFFELQLIAHDPFSYLLSTADEEILDSEIGLETERRLLENYSFAVTGNTTVQVNNFGIVDVAPIIEVTGSFTTFSVTSGENILVYSNPLASSTLILDNDKMTAKEGIVNRNNKVSGSFIELPVGINNVQISGTGLNCTVSFVFHPKFI